MRIAVLSGKGGTGKTFVSVNLACVSGSAVYIDCDVEEPNGRLFLRPKHTSKTEVSVLLPKFDETKCSSCRECVRFCKFNALAFIKNKPFVFKDVCHSCGGCKLMCRSNAVTEIETPIGSIETGIHDNIKVVTGELNIGEASGVPVIRQALRMGFAYGNKITIIDCPPVSACSVTESITTADYCLLVAEPTTFWLYNLGMVANLVKIIKKPCGVVVNKHDGMYPALEEFCKENALPILARIPYTKETAHTISEGKIVVEENKELYLLFCNLLAQIGGIP